MRFYRGRGYGYRDVRFENEDALKISRKISSLIKELESFASIANTLDTQDILKLMSDNKNDSTLELAFKYWREAKKSVLDARYKLSLSMGLFDKFRKTY